MKILKKEVEFNGVNLTGIKTQEGKIYIIVKAFCEILGIDPSGQLKRIKRDETLNEGVDMMSIPTESGKQDTTLLELDFLPMWLTGIRAERCKKEIRPYLKEFKLKAKDVLADAFLGKRLEPKF
ncbi:phage antirepressor N-terminal domain-containing protein [Sebaldella sp. S0638]|uniref:phage antirepressor N-terminal domain-containing protein n=1 Tax=Sebaldella sp. S0638 TaxID=2957809 RepID=UPI00209D0907|nr:phage antirepressor N-terminal domain-containing protein [Sebaldella sp. S0638]MCP1226345.1 phage antirepressor N-terminal domain-containing protein [Sebaldella sp. S0638]